MATSNFLYIFILLLSSLCSSISGGLEAERFQSATTGKRKLQNLVRKLDETISQPSTTSITNPANFPPYTTTPTVVTIPASNPTAPVNNPLPTISAPDPGNTPVVYPVNQPTTNAPITPGQTWCIAKTGAPETSLQDALDYACGIGGADCSIIQQGGSCYNPNSLENHASFAFNTYFQKNPSPTSCHFGGTAVLVNTNPSSGSCVYPSSATAASAVPLTENPPTTETPSSTIPTPTTSSTGITGSPSYGVLPAGTYGSPPSLSNQSNPNSLFPANFGPDSPPTAISVRAGSAALQPPFDLIILVAFFFTGKLILGI